MGDGVMARRKNDFYCTPDALTLALIDYMPEIVQTTSIYDPCAGDGRMAKLLAKNGAFAWLNDIDPQWNTSYNLDARTFFPGGQQFHWLVTNPPFNCADQIFLNHRQRGKTALVNGIALLLRLSWLEPTKRRQFLKDDPPNSIVVLPRTSFTEDGKTDSVTCAWMIWHEIPMDNKIAVYTNNQLKELEQAWQTKQQPKPTPQPTPFPLTYPPPSPETLKTLQWLQDQVQAKEKDMKYWVQQRQMQIKEKK